MLKFLILSLSGLVSANDQAPFTPQERFEVLMEATGGARVMPSFDINDFVELVGKPEGAKQKTDFKMVLLYTYLGPKRESFECPECFNFHKDTELVMQHVVQGEGLICT